jgi:hypothetical protein
VDTSHTDTFNYIKLFAHVFLPNFIIFRYFQMGLPEAYFPEYNMVYRMMRNPREKYDLYQAIPESTLKEIKTVNGCHYVTIQKNDEDVSFEVSYCAILIGSRPDLSLLSNITSSISTNKSHKLNESISENIAIRGLRRLKIFCEKCRDLNLCFGYRNRNLLNTLIDNSNSVASRSCECENLLSEKRLAINDSGIGFGDDPKKSVDCKNNPIAVNKFSNELLTVPGIFAMGPLVGDNFVRFIAGGALSISSHIFTEKLSN